MKGSVPVRKRSTLVERAKILADYHASGLTQREFAGKVGISLACLSIWLRRSRQHSSSSPSAPVGFVPVQLQGGIGPNHSSDSERIEIELPGKLLVRLPRIYSQAEALLFILQLRQSC